MPSSISQMPLCSSPWKNTLPPSLDRDLAAFAPQHFPVRARDRRDRKLAPSFSSSTVSARNSAGSLAAMASEGGQRAVHGAASCNSGVCDRNAASAVISVSLRRLARYCASPRSASLSRSAGTKIRELLGDIEVALAGEPRRDGVAPAERGRGRAMAGHASRDAVDADGRELSRAGEVGWRLDASAAARAASAVANQSATRRDVGFVQFGRGFQHLAAVVLAMPVAKVVQLLDDVGGTSDRRAAGNLMRLPAPSSP